MNPGENWESRKVTVGKERRHLLERMVLSAAAAVFLGVSSAGAGVVAHWRGGDITTDDVASWRAASGQKAATSTSTLEKDVNDIVLLRSMAGRAEPLRNSREGELQWQLIKRQVAVDVLRSKLRAESQPTGEAVRLLYEERKASMSQPRRWRLLNIFLAFEEDSTPAAKRAVLDRMHHIIDALEAGADFGEAANKNSMSSTAVRAGRMGWVSLDELEPQVAEAVAELGVGDLSRPIETTNGITLLRCAGIIGAGPPDFAKVEKRLASEIQVESMTRIMNALHQQIQETTTVTEILPDPGEQGTFEGYFELVSTDVRRKIDADEIELFRKARGIKNGESWEEDFVLEVGMAAEAERRGFLDDNSVHNRLRWARPQVAAQLYLMKHVPERVQSPDLDDLTTAFAVHRDDFVEPERLRLSVLEVELGRSTPLDVVGRAHEASADLAGRECNFEAVAGAIDPSGSWVSIRDLGWMKTQDVFFLGAAIEAAVEELEPGRCSGLVQEGRRLIFIQCQERHASRRLSFDEVRSHVERLVVKQRRREAEAQLIAEILGEAEIEILDAGSVDGLGFIAEGK